MKEMGEFLANALYNYNDSQYPLCRGLEEGIRELKKLTKYLVILSNRMKRSAESILRSKRILRYFDEVFAPEDIRENITKPVRGVLEKYGNLENPPIKFDEMKTLSVFIGDSNVDISSAHDQGPIITIATLQGMGSERVLKHSHPYKIVSSVKDAVNVIKQIRKDPVKSYNEHVIKINQK